MMKKAASSSPIDFRALFEASPSPMLILDPGLRIVAVNDAYQRATQTHRDTMVGHDVFEVFPDNPDDVGSTGVSNLRASLERVLALRRPDAMAIQKYDIRVSKGGATRFEARHWTPLNTPVLGADGEVQFIIHRVDDVTEHGSLLEQGEVAQRLVAHQRAVIAELGSANAALGEEIRARTSAQEALRDSRSYVRLLLDSTAEGLYAVDREGTTTLCNRAFLEMLGFGSEAEAVGRKLHGDIHHAHPDGSFYPVADCPIYRCARTGEAAHVTGEVFFRVDGTPLPVEYWAYPIWREGKLEGAICTFLDVSSRRQSEEAARASEAQFRALAQAMPNHVWASAPNGSLDWFNEGVYAYSGAPPGTLNGRGWEALVHRDDLELAGARWAESLATGKPYEVEFRLRRADGAYRWHLARAVPIHGEDGEIVRWVGANTDIEDQKAAADALKELNDALEARVEERTRERDRAWRNSQDLRVVIDEGGVFKDVSPASKSILGWTPDQMLGRTVFDFLHPDDLEPTNGALDDAKQSVLPMFENRYRHKDGGYRWLSWVAGPEGSLIYATGRNITAEKEQQAALAQAQEALRQSQKMEAVGQLTGGLAHDFNNLLTGISGSLEMMQTRMAQGRLGGIERYIDVAQGAARRAASLTHRLLAFSRRQTLDPKPTDVNRLVMGMEELIRRTVGPAVELEVVGASGLWTTLVDPSQLENGLLNLCINARDAMPDGGRLTIETANRWLDERAAREQDLPPGQFISLCVTDTGTGMTAEVISRAFDPFFTTKPLGEGTGLGLSMIYGFARQSGGQVRIYSELGKGTTMCLYLPRHRSGPEAPHDPSIFDGARPGGSGEVVLVIDDEPSIRMLAAEVLEDAGYAVLEAAEGSAGLRLLRSDARIDLLITDVGLPGGMNGRQIADAARALRPDLKVLFITGYAENAAVGNGHLEPGMQVLTKPFAIDVLRARIREMVES